MQPTQLVPEPTLLCPLRCIVSEILTFRSLHGVHEILP